MACDSHGLLEPIAKPSSNWRGLALNTARVMAGICCLLGPVLTLGILLVCSPKIVEGLLASYTREYVGVFEDGWSSASYRMLSFASQIYSKHLLIRTAALFYNFLKPAIVLAGIAAVAALIVGRIVRRTPLSRQRLALALSGFLVIVTCAVLACRAPAPVSLVIGSTGIFILNFVLIGVCLDRGDGNRLLRFRYLAVPIGLGATVGISHLLAPAPTLAVVARCIRPKSSSLARFAAHAGQGLACLISFPGIILAIYAIQPIPLSPEVRPLLEYAGLYDMAIDEPTRRLLVTESGARSTYVTGETQCSLFAFDLDTLELSGWFLVPSMEIEDIELDCERREIYHVDRATGVMLIVDADEFELRDTVPLPVAGSSGSTKLVLDKSSDCLLVSFENNNLYLFNRGTHDCSCMGSPGEVRLVADPANDVVYLNRVRANEITAFDVRRRAIVSPGVKSERWARMVLSPKRQELYVTDAPRGTVHVYSTPKLEYLRDIQTQFGVRATAVDDENGLLLAASVITGYLDVIDLDNGQRLARYYVGGYCRNLRVDPSTRRAFVTLTANGLYSVDY